MATAQELELLQLLNDPWRSMEARGIYGKYGSLAEEMADDYAIAEETAKARLKSPRGFPGVDDPAQIYAETFGPVERRWKGAPAATKFQVVQGRDGGVYEYNPTSGAMRELVKPPVAQQFNTEVETRFDETTGNEIKTTRKVPVGASAAGAATGAAKGTPSKMTFGKYTVELDSPEAPVAGPVRPTPTGFIGTPGGANMFQPSPFGVAQTEAAPAQPLVTPEMFLGKAWRPALPTAESPAIAPAPSGAPFEPVSVGAPEAQSIPGIRPPSAFTPTPRFAPGRTATGEQRGAISRLKQRRIKELTENLQAGVKPGRVAGPGYPTQESYRKAYEELQGLIKETAGDMPAFEPSATVARGRTVTPEQLAGISRSKQRGGSGMSMFPFGMAGGSPQFAPSDRSVERIYPTFFNRTDERIKELIGKLTSAGGYPTREAYQEAYDELNSLLGK